jgi:hypothetical protein
MAWNRSKSQFNRLLNHATVVDASEIRLLAANFAELRDEIQKGTEKAHAAAIKVVYEQALTNASSLSPQASKAAHDPRTFRSRALADRSSLFLDGGTHKAGDDKHSPYNYVIGSEFGAKRDLERPLLPKLHRGFGRVKNPKSKKYGDLPQEMPARDSMLGWNQFHPWRGNSKVMGEDGLPPGYWMFPSLRQTREEVVNTFGTAAMKTVRDVLNN